MAKTRITGMSQLERLAKDLREEIDGKERKRAMTRGFRDAVKPVATEIKAAIARMPSKGHRARKARYGRPEGTLRKELSNAVTTQVRTSGNRSGVSIFMNPRKMPDGTKGLPAYFERVPGKTNLRHPIFGKWLEGQPSQKVPPGGYFTSGAGTLAKSATKAVNDVVDKVIRDLEY